MEQTIMAAEENVADLSTKIQDPGIMSTPQLLADICRDLEEAQAQVQALYARWELLEQKKADAGK